MHISDIHIEKSAEEAQNREHLVNAVRFLFCLSEIVLVKSNSSSHIILQGIKQLPCDKIE